MGTAGREGEASVQGVRFMHEGSAIEIDRLLSEPMCIVDQSPKDRPPDS
jgi:hypothetical protein